MASTNTQSVPVDEESSDWDMSSSGEDVPPVKADSAVEASSSWDLEVKTVRIRLLNHLLQKMSLQIGIFHRKQKSRRNPSLEVVEEESSSWGFSSEEDNVPPPKKATKPKIQKPYMEPKVEKAPKKGQESNKYID